MWWVTGFESILYENKKDNIQQVKYFITNKSLGFSKHLFLNMWKLYLYSKFYRNSISVIKLNKVSHIYLFQSFVF